MHTACHSIQYYVLEVDHETRALENDPHLVFSWKFFTSFTVNFILTHATATLLDVTAFQHVHKFDNRIDDPWVVQSNCEINLSLFTEKFDENETRANIHKMSAFEVFKMSLIPQPKIHVSKLNLNKPTHMRCFTSDFPIKRNETIASQTVNTNEIPHMDHDTKCRSDFQSSYDVGSLHLTESLIRN